MNPSSLALHRRVGVAAVVAALALPLAACGSGQRATPGIDSTPTSTDSPTSTPTEATPSETPSSSPTGGPAIMKTGSRGERVRELQARLAQIGWWGESITPNYGDETAAAVAGFQSKRGLPTTGEVDQATWDRLTAMTEQPTHDQMHNILKPGPTLLGQGSSGAKVRDLQARLKQAQWYSGDVTGTYDAKTIAAVKGFQERREIPVTGAVDQRTLDKLTAMTTTPTKAELTNTEPKSDEKAEAEGKAKGLDPRCMTGRVICISKKSNQLWWVIDGKVKLNLDVRFGTAETPTRNGVFSVQRKSRDHVSSIYHTSMPYAMFFSGGQAVHYSSDFAARGYRGGSHGCVNVRSKSGITSLFNQVNVGDKVVVHS